MVQKKIKKLVLWDFDAQGTLPVTSDKIVEKKRFHPDGLYSERIFGPVKDYVCSCGTYDQTGGVCPVCGVKFAPSSLRSTTFGHIQLPTDVINPLFLWNITARGKSKTIFDLLSLINFETFLWFDKDNNPRQTKIKLWRKLQIENEKDLVNENENYLYKENDSYQVPMQNAVVSAKTDTESSNPLSDVDNLSAVADGENFDSIKNNVVIKDNGTGSQSTDIKKSEDTETDSDEQLDDVTYEELSKAQKYVGAHAVMKIIDFLQEHVKKDEAFNVYDYIRKREWDLLVKFKDHITIDKIPVIPPDLRPMMFTGNNMSVAETLTRLYTTLLTKLNIMNNKTKFIKDINSLTWENYKDLQKQVSGIYDEIMDVFGGKKGIIRANILGKRIDYSGRAVIAVDPSLKYNECRIPYHMALEVYKYEFGRYLAKKHKKMLLVVLREIEESLKMKTYVFIDELEEWIKDKPTLLNRQPTLHQYGMLAFNTKISSDSTIKISPTCTASYNADFDGF